MRPGGRPRSVTPDKLNELRVLYSKLRNKAEVARVVKMPKATVRYYLDDKPKEETAPGFFNWKDYNNEIY